MRLGFFCSFGAPFSMAYQPKDAFYHKAKREGYRSRAAYKLLELNRRFRIIRAGDRVVDLGAAPGGWLQVASQLVGPKGKVVGVDVQAIEPLGTQNIHLLRADIASEETLTKIKELLGSLADCVISDLSPHLSGIHDADINRSAELVRKALQVACAVLRPGGHFVIKAFVGEEMGALSREIGRHFGSLARTRPEATRKGSSEIYLVAKGFRGTR